MPTIVTRGVASARGAGTFSAAPPPPPPPPPTPTPPPPPPPGPPPVFQTVTFNSSDVWTAPAGVSTILNLQVAGGTFVQTPEEWLYSSGAINPILSTIGGSPESPEFYTYAQAGSYADSVLAAANSGGTGARNFSYSSLILFGTSTSPPQYWINEVPGTIRIRGVATATSGPWDNRSGQNANGLFGVFWSIGVEYNVPAETRNGTPSSAFGFTAAGTTSAGQPQIITSASSVSVTPGQQYNIQVGDANGYVQFQFSQS